MKEIRVVVTMDCEPITAGTHSAATGPDSWELGERATTGYAQIAGSFGFPVSYFIHPETALAQPEVFHSLAKDGACLGLHMHPWKYSLSRHGGLRFREHYGALSEDQQRELLSESAALWREGMGCRPVYFRPGTFSANDSAFKILAELGFRGGSCSLPGRMMPEFRAAWVGTAPDPHRGHRTFRLLEGDLDFAEMPLSTDSSLALTGRIGGKLHPDLRPDTDWMTHYQLTYAQIAANIVTQIQDRAPDVPVINLVSHNHFDYRNPGAAATIRFKQSLEAIHEACHAAGLRAVGATLAQVCDDVLSRAPKTPGLVCEGTVYGPPGKVAVLEAQPVGAR